VIGENGAGKTTFLRCLMGEITPNSGSVKWAENATLGYCPQDSTADFDCDLNLFDWMSQWRKPHHDDQIARAPLGRLLFSNGRDPSRSGQESCSGGEQGSPAVRPS
jgi:ATPase subunit of ABC transporter with duplicated ATPase domains